jgi:hypothetical protein
MRAVACAFEDGIAAQMGGQPASEIHLTVYLHPADHTLLLNQYPFIDRQITAYVVDVSRERGILLAGEPVIVLQADKGQERGSISVFATLPEEDAPDDTTIHTEKMESSPAVPFKPPPNAQLLRDGRIVIRLDRHIINIGRRPDNHLMLDDHRISRQHAQIRLRDGRYVIYDLNSTHGVFVNNQRISEYTLQNGDVISLGGIRLIYLQDETLDMDNPFDDDTSIRPPEEWSG